ncbi:MAG: ABC transporter permease subunit [Planctomycetota bacterium]
MTRKLPVYLGILVGLLVVVGALAGFLIGTEQPRAAWFVAVAGNLLLSAWLVWGLWVWRDVPWVAWVSRILILGLATQLLTSAAFAVNLPGLGALVLGAGGMGLAFMIGLALLKFLFNVGHPTLGIARTILDEAIRQKIGLIFVVILVVLVPLLPLILSDTRLEYRVSNFLRYSMFITGLVLSLMTILLCARSVSREVESKVAFTTLTKPVARWQYLLGKWLGVTGLNAVLLAVAGVGVYAFTMSIAQTPAQDRLDAAAVQDSVLTARVSVRPDEVSAGQLTRDVEERLDLLRLQEPDLYTRVDPVTGERRPIPAEDLPAELSQPIQAQVISEWLSIAPRGSASYRFSGLSDAAEYGDYLQLRFKPEARGAAPPDRRLQLWFRANGRELPFLVEEAGEIIASPMPRMPEDKFALIRIPVTAVSAEGTLDLEIFNGGRGGPAQGTIAFNPADGMEMLYQIGGFEANLVRGLGMLWIRLMFLAMLGITAATFLGFPTACLLCGLVFTTAVGASYLNESLDQYSAFAADELNWWQTVIGVLATIVDKLATGEYYDAFKVVIRTVGELFTLIVPDLSEYNPTPLIAEGKAVTWSLVGGALLWIGGLWTGLLGLIAAWIFGQREVAKVTV